jgi:hypothetical protein
MYYDTATNILYWWNGTAWVGGPGTTRVARAYRNAAITGLANAAWTALPTDTASYDPGGNLSAAKDRYTCPTTGYYHFNATIEGGGSVSGVAIGAAIMKNGTVAAAGAISQVSNTASPIGASVSDIVSCNANDYLQLAYGIWTAASATIYTGASATWFSVVWVG